MRLAIRFLGWYSLNSPENRHTKEKHENRKRGPGNDWTQSHVSVISGASFCLLSFDCFAPRSFGVEKEWKTPTLLQIQSNPTYKTNNEKNTTTIFSKQPSCPKTSISISIQPPQENQWNSTYMCWKLSNANLVTSIQSIQLQLVIFDKPQELAIETVLEWQFNTELHRRCQTFGVRPRRVASSRWVG